MRLPMFWLNPVGADAIEEFSGPPPQTPWTKWVDGVLLALAFAVYGLSCCWADRASFFGSEFFVVHGRAVLAWGIVWISLGLFFHCHFFWGCSARLWRYSPAGKALSVLSFIGSLCYVMYSWLASAYR